MHSVVMNDYKKHVLARNMLFRLARGYTHTLDYAMGITRSSPAMQCE